MPLVNLHDMLTYAQRSDFAVAGFELMGMEFLDGVISAAEQAHAPVILGVTAQTGFAPLLAAAVCAARNSSVPVAVQLEGVATEETAALGIRHGCNGFTWDTTDLQPNENLTAARVAAALAASCGVTAGVTLTFPADAKTAVSGAIAAAGRFVRDTGAAFLHLRRDGEMPGDGDELSTVLRQYAALGVPLSVDEEDMSEDVLMEAVAGGVAKVRCAAELSNAALQRCRNLNTPTKGGYSAVSQRIRQGINEAAALRLHAWGGAGRAAEVLSRCRRHREVEHVILYNAAGGMAEAEVAALMQDGRRILSAVPGVRRVVAGRAVADDAPYRYCWLIRFAARPVIDSYREHPDHKRFADQQFRPIAGNRVHIDFEEVD